MEEKGLFKITSKKGFHVTFSNGITISTQFGAGNYCNNYELDIRTTMKDYVLSGNAEIAIWNENGEWITSKIMESLGEECGDDVYGYVSVDLWLKILNICSQWKE